MLVRGAHRGFTLMDVLISILVLTIGVAGLLAMQITAVNANARAREILEAARLAQDKIEQFRNSPLLGGATWEIVDTRGCRQTNNLGQADTRAFCVGPPWGMRYYRQWRFNPLGVNPPNNDHVEVTVCWMVPADCPLSCAVPANPRCQLHSTRVSNVR